MSRLSLRMFSAVYGKRRDIVLTSAGQLRQYTSEPPDKIGSICFDAELYNSIRELQNKDTKTFLQSIIRRMDWSRQEEDVVMDVGCGPGVSCQKLFLPAFPKVKKFIGVDIMKSMIEFAKEKNTDERIEFYEANIEDSETIKRWSQQITKVISVYCLHWLKSMPVGFSNIYDLLKPGGEAALLFVLSCRAWDSYEPLCNNPKWSEYIKNVYPCVPESHYNNHSTAYFCTLLEHMGFKVILTEYDEKGHIYKDDNQCRDFIYALCAYSNHIPKELVEDFKDDLFRGFLKYSGRGSEGKPIRYFTTLGVLLRKPDPSDWRPRGALTRV